MEFGVKGQTDAKRILDRPGLNTPGEDAAWDGLRERVVITLRPIGAPTSIGFFGLAAAMFCMAGLQLGLVDQAEGKKVAPVLIGFAFVAQLIARDLQLPRPRDGDAGAGADVARRRRDAMDIEAGIDQ
jgi:hypothetical protein